MLIWSHILLAAFIHLFGLSSKNAHNLSNERRHLYFQFTPFIIRRVFEIRPKSITTSRTSYYRCLQWWKNIFLIFFFTTWPYPRSAAENDSEAFRLKQQKKKEKNHLFTFVGQASAFLKVCLEEESRTQTRYRNMTSLSFNLEIIFESIIGPWLQKRRLLIVTKKFKSREKNHIMKHRSLFIHVNTRTQRQENWVFWQKQGVSVREKWSWGHQ